jgi:anti-sigma B factor antagonist
MKANTRQIGEVSIVDLSGQITIGAGDVQMRDAVLALLEGGQKQILLNLEKVSYMDSAGIGELVACFKRAKERGGMVKLVNPTGKVYDLLQLTKLEDIFQVFKDEKEALVSF